jgi:hypothetical protein
MTQQNTMPDNIELGYFYAGCPMSEYFFSVIDKETKLEPLMTAKYIRADTHTDLLKQARDALNSANNTYLGSEYVYVLKPDIVEQTIAAIDKVLGGDK